MLEHHAWPDGAGCRADACAARVTLLVCVIPLVLRSSASLQGTLVWVIFETGS